MESVAYGRNVVGLCFKNSKNEADNAIFRLKVYLKERGIYVSPITGVGGNSGFRIVQT